MSYSITIKSKVIFTYKELFLNLKNKEIRTDFIQGNTLDLVIRGTQHFMQEGKSIRGVELNYEN